MKRLFILAIMLMGILGDVSAGPLDVAITIGSAEQGVYCSEYDLDFTKVSNLKAFIIKYDSEAKMLIAVRVTDVPAGTGICMIGPSGEYIVPTGNSTANYKENLLVGSLDATTIYTNEVIDGVDYVNYYLSRGRYGVGFYKVNGSVDLKNNVAYLHVPLNISDSFMGDYLSITYVDETGIEDESTEEDNTDGVPIDGIIYKLAKETKTAVVVNNTLNSIGNVAIPDHFVHEGVEYNVTSIGSNAFRSCSNLTGITIPNSVTSIGNSAFYDCRNLVSVSLGNGVETIGEKAFCYCAFEKIEIPTSVKVIERDAFNISPILPDDGGERHDDGGDIALSRGESDSHILKEVYIHDLAAWCAISFLSLGSNPLYQAEKLFVDGKEMVDLEIPNGVSSICNNAFIQFYGLKSIVIPNSVTTIGDWAFYNCYNLTSVSLGNKLEIIGRDAFRNCKSLESITIPDYDTWIQWYAFGGCEKLTSVYSLKSDLKYYLESDAFTDIANTAVLYIPKDTSKEYKEKGWTQYFASVVEMFTNTLYPHNLSTRSGNKPTLSIAMDNESMITAIQFDLVLPEGVAVATDEDGMLISLSTRALKSHTVAKRKLDDGSIRIICSSNSNGVFTGNDGSVVFVKLDISNNLADGEYSVMVKNIELSSNDGESFHPDDVEAKITIGGEIIGDVDNNGYVTVNDAVCIVREILGLPNVTFNKVVADVDGNGSITINDKVVLINRYILGRYKARTRGGDEVEGNSSLYIANFTMRPGETRTIDVLMETDRTDIEALQCDIYLPDGLSFVASEEEGELYYAEKGERATRSHSVASFIQEDGALRIVESTDDGTAFRQNDKSVFTFTVKASDKMKIGNYTIRLANMELSYGVPITPADININVKISEGKPNITISSAKQLPYCSENNLDFTDEPDLKAYVATGYDKATGTIWLTRVRQVPANTGFLLVGEAGDYEIPTIDGVSDIYYKNMFKGTLEATTIQTTEGDYTNYYLSNGASGVGFYKVTKSEGQSIGANRCYLPIPTDIPANGAEGDAEVIKVSSALQVPYYTSKNLDFTTMDAQGVKAYTATGYNYGTGTIWLTRVKKVPAHTGVLVMAGEAGEYSIPTASVSSYYANMFVGSETAQTIYTNETVDGIDYVNYYLSNGEAGVGFYKVTNSAGQSLGANRCYLQVPYRATSGARGGSRDVAPTWCNMVLSDEGDDVIGIPLFTEGETGIQSPMFNDQSSDVYYNLQGQRVEKPGKGIYIKNGKKVVIK